MAEAIETALIYAHGYINLSRELVEDAKKTETDEQAHRIYANMNALLLVANRHIEKALVILDKV